MLVGSLAMAQIQPEEILFIPWNTDTLGNISYSLDPEGRVGPLNFQIYGDSVCLLDQRNSMINIYSKNRLVDRLPVTPMAKDFLLKSSEEYVCLAENGLNIYRHRNLIEQIRSARPLPVMQGILRHNDELMVANHDGSISRITNRRLAKSSQPGIVTYQLRKVSRSLANLVVIDENGKPTNRFDLSFSENNLGSFTLTGADKSGRLFLDIDLIIQEVPLRVRREVWILNPNGEQVGKITIPPHCFTMTWNDLRLTEEGLLYHMLSSEDGIHVMKWNLFSEKSGCCTGEYPEKYQRYLHYNDAIQSEPEPSQKKSPLSNPSFTVTRSQALATADTYAVHAWTCTASNLTSAAGVTAPDGLLIITPTWIEAGSNFRIPYQWGGFSTLTQYDAGLLAGKYAGDKYTSKSSGSSYAVGVDCSGFVSRCWNLSSHYSTSMMPNITTAYPSWDSLKAGDAIHRVGHVRLAVENLQNGSILAVEAAGSGTDWRVNYRTYTYSELSGYSPRYYNNMIGPSLAISQPVLVATNVKNTQTDLLWNLNSTDNVSGIQIQYSENGTDWNNLLGDSLLSPSLNEYTGDLPGGPVFFRVKSINNENNSLVESLPSDTYGFYQAANCAGKILIVDGFDRASGSWGLPYHTFAQWMGENLVELGISFETVANEAVISGKVSLEDYGAVFWILGDESTADETFSPTEQTIVINYLKSGGQLFVSGSEVAWDLDSEGSSTDKAFFLNYLHADYVQDDANDYTVTGTAAGIFSGLSIEFDDGSSGIYDEDYPDVIKPMLNAATCLEYSNGITAGIQYEGLFGDGVKIGKLVYFGFPWETVKNAAARKALLKNISEWFGFTCSGIQEKDGALPVKATLSHAYPNPFNSQVMFKLTVPDQTDVEIMVYNTLGHLVRRLDRLKTNTGEYDLIWDGRNNAGELVATGCYFLRVITNNTVLTDKVVFLK